MARNFCAIMGQLLLGLYYLTFEGIFHQGPYGYSLEAEYCILIFHCNDWFGLLIINILDSFDYVQRAILIGHPFVSSRRPPGMNSFLSLEITYFIIKHQLCENSFLCTRNMFLGISTHVGFFFNV